MRIGILNIGNELLSGRRLNTNSHDIARLLCPWGAEVAFVHVLPDEPNALVAELESVLGPRGPSGPPMEAASGLDWLLITGGLGPTRDDLTRDALSAYLGAPLEPSQKAREWLQAFMAGRTGAVRETQLVQTMIPQGMEPLYNPRGTACGIMGEHYGVRLAVFPGVPAELRAMLSLHVLPTLKADRKTAERKVWTWGLSESHQQELLADVIIPSDFHFSSLPSDKGVEISLGGGWPEAEFQKKELELEGLWEAILTRLPGQNVVDRSGAGIQEVVVRELLRKKATVAVAESCTAGALGFLMTQEPGSSRYFLGGFQTYSNSAKLKQLGVSEELLERCGAVSEEVALAMCEGCLKVTGADYVCSVTGIAGPDGGTPEKPVGLVWLAAGSRGRLLTEKTFWRGDRDEIRWRSAYGAIRLLAKSLQ